jgi:hypothetical protein
VNIVVAALPCDGPGDKCWAVHVVNLGDVAIQVHLEQVSYEWGDYGSSEALNALCGPIGPGASLEVYRETATEMRTGLTMTLTGGGRTAGAYAELGRLYAFAHASGLQPIPELGGQIGKRAEVNVLESG